MLRFLLAEVAGEALARGRADRAAHLVGALVRLEEAGELPRLVDTVNADLLISVREALGEAEAEAAMAKGRGLTLNEALELAFSG